jgi:nucleoside phosphorylase
MVADVEQIQKWTIFLSHSSLDKEFVDWLYSKLISANLSVWYDRYEILVGDSIIQRINEGLTGSTFVVVVLSQQANESNWVKAELEPKILEQIENDAATILPVVIDKVDVGKTSSFLKGKRYIQFPREGSDEKFRELLRSIEGHLGRQVDTDTFVCEPKPAAQNPFGLRGGVEPDRFIIPASLVEEVTGDIVKKQAVSIVAPRMLGKTSLLRFLPSARCAPYYENEDGQLRQLSFVNIDLQQHSGKSCDDLLIEIARRMSTPSVIAPKGDRLAHLTFIKERAGQYDKEKPLWILAFDEFDQVINLSGLNKIFFDELRTLPDNCNLSFVIASRKKLLDLPLPQDASTSYFFNIFNEHFLGVWDEETSRNLAFEPRGAKLDVLKESDFRFVTELTAKHPALLQMGCYYLFNARRKTKESDISYEDVRDLYSERAETTYRYYLEHELSEEERAWLHDCWDALKSENKAFLKELETNTSQRVNSTIRQGLAKLGLVSAKTGEIRLPSGFENFLNQKVVSSVRSHGATRDEEHAESLSNERGSGQSPNGPQNKSKLNRLGTKVDFAIISIRDDEFRAVLQRLGKRQVLRKNRRYYSLSNVQAINEAEYVVAAVKCSEQGTGEAQTVAQNIIRDLDPRWILVVGIAGGIPSSDFSLGDVVVSTRINDFTVNAVFENAPPDYSISGGPNKREVADVVSFLPALDELLVGWNTVESISLERPKVMVPPPDRLLYGNLTWQKKVRESLNANFGSKSKTRLPLVVSGPIDSSDSLIKDTRTLNRWLRVTRNALAVEMESAGIYRAARSGKKEYPFLAIRGISDIVGLKRTSVWTSYACHTAAAFALSFIKTGIIES